jgi:hypothetical protein
MFSIVPVFACRGPVLTTGETALLLSVLGGWLAAVILSIVNGIFILLMPKRISMLIHGSIFACYIGLAFLLFIVGSSDKIQNLWVQEACTVLAFAIPISVIAHFIYLMVFRRRQKNEPAKDI